MTLPSPLPKGSNADSVIGYTVTVLEEPEYTDSKTIVRSEVWYIQILGYKEIIPGSRIKFVGKVESQMVMGKVVRIKMIDPKAEYVSMNAGETISPLQKMMIVLASWRKKWVGILQLSLPEPMASLAAGILLGVKGQMPQDFYLALVATGTLHIVAASGYNVSIVAEVLMKALSGLVARGVGVATGIFGIILYVLISGGSASVVRAGIMGSLTLVAYYFGRPTEARRLLWVTGGIMLLVNPMMLVDIGFQLSFVATIGLLYLEPLMKKLPQHKFLTEYLYPTLAASTLTLPVILYHFGRVSWISPIVNILILPVVPLVMGMTAIQILLGSISSGLGQVVAWLVYVPLGWMVFVIKLFSF